MATDIVRVNLPISICRGPLRFGDVTLDAHVLDDGERVLTQSTAIAALTGGTASKGGLDRYIERLPGKPEGFSVVPVLFQIPSNPTRGHGITGEAFVAIVKLYADAFISGTLHTQQRAIGERCARIVFALAGLAMTALIDEATGYRERNYAQEIERKIATYLLPAPADWERTFPPEFFTLACKVYRIGRNGKKNPGFVQQFIRVFVYDYLDADVAKEVKARNPSPHFGSNHHQHYADRSKVLLNAHIVRLMSVMRQSRDRHDFAMRFACEFKGAGLQLDLPPKGN